MGLGLDKTRPPAPGQEADEDNLRDVFPIFSTNDGMLSALLVTPMRRF